MIAGQMFNHGRVLPVEELGAKLDAVDAAAVRRFGAAMMAARMPRHRGGRSRWQARALRNISRGASVCGRPCARPNERWPMAFMRGLTFPGGQQPIIRGDGVYLRYPRIADYLVWSRLRGESRDFWRPGSRPGPATN